MMDIVKICASLLLVLFLASCSPAITPHPTSPPPTPTVSTDCPVGSRVEHLTSGGETRQYQLYIPSSYQPGKPVALVFGFHGNNGRAEHFEAYSGFSQLAEHEGFIVVYPQGFGEYPTWETWAGSKDVQFVRDIIDQIASDCSIDPARIYASGHSLGGGMANRLACDLSERIAAIGPVAGAYQYAEICSPTRPVAIAAVHGTGDSIIFYNGFGANGNPPGAYFTVGTPIPQWASAWAQRNNCNIRPSIIFQKNLVSAQQWGNCRTGADVVLYTIQDGEHGWPAATEEFDVTQTIWEFFKKHSLQPTPAGS